MLALAGTAAAVDVDLTPAARIIVREGGADGTAGVLRAFRAVRDDGTPRYPPQLIRQASRALAHLGGADIALPPPGPTADGVESIEARAPPSLWASADVRAGRLFRGLPAAEAESRRDGGRPARLRIPAGAAAGPARLREPCRGRRTPGPEGSGLGTVVSFTGPRQVALEKYEDPPLRTGEVRLRTLYSGISAGTELTAYRGTNPYLHRRWDGARRLFVADPQRAPGPAYPLRGWGYEEVGEVAELGAGSTALQLGDLVWGAWGHASTHVVRQEWAAARRLPAGLEPLAGIFAQIGAIALNAVLDADIHVGESVAVFGQGVPGLLATQLARQNGAEVIALDAVPQRLQISRECGATHTVDIRAQDAAEAIKALTDGRGADVCIEFSGTYAGLHQAIRAVAYNSRVVAAGFYQGEGVGLALGDEFHHNRVEVVCAQISGVNPRLDHRWDRLRLDRTVMRLQAEGRLDCRRLVSQVLPVAQAAEAFALLDARPAEALQIVLQF